MKQERRVQINTTLSEKELDFIRDNIDSMSQTEMARRLHCSQGKVFNNARIAGIPFPQRVSTKNKSKKVKECNGYFNVDDCKNWVLGNYNN